VGEKGPRCARGCLWALPAPFDAGGAGTGSAGREGAERGSPRTSEGGFVRCQSSRGTLRAPPVGRSRRLGLARGLLARQGREVWGNPRRSVDALRPGVEPSTLRACLHAWFPYSGGPLFSLHPGAGRWRSVAFGVPLLLRQCVLPRYVEVSA